MKEYQIYLCGATGKFGKDEFDKGNTWRVYCKNTLEQFEGTTYKVRVINPNDYFNFKDDLRLVSKLQNNINRKPRNNIISGVNRVRNKWLATLTYKGEFVLRKCFSTENKAIQARLEAENKYYGQYSYHNSRNIQT